MPCALRKWIIFLIILVKRCHLRRWRRWWRPSGQVHRSPTTTPGWMTGGRRWRHSLWSLWDGWRLNRMIISHVAFIDARISSAGFQRILEFCTRSNIGVIVPIIFRGLSFCFSNLSRVRCRAGSTISCGSPSDTTSRWRRRGRSGLQLRGRRRDCWNWWRSSSNSFLWWRA